MTSDDTPQGAGAWLAARCLASPAELSTAMRLAAAGGRSNDACLHARQYLERALGPELPLAAGDYRQAAALLYRSSGPGLAAGDLMEALAGVDTELRATAGTWHSRYAGRPPTEAERRAEASLRSREVVESGQAGQGIDGAHYTKAYYPRSGKPAVVITTSALTEEIVNFANKDDALAWLASRSAGRAGPLPTTAGGPATRTAREEELLAFLIRQPKAARDLGAAAGPATWTTHLRAEAFAAVRWLTAEGGDPGYGVVAATFGRRLLRAPGSAAGDIGWPDATRAMAYLHRLAATPVDEARAAAAARELAAADAAAAVHARSARPPANPAPATAQRATDRWLLPPAQVPGRISPAPRLLAIRTAAGYAPAATVPIPGRPAVTALTAPDPQAQPPPPAARGPSPNRRHSCHDEDRRKTRRSAAPAPPRPPATPPASSAKPSSSPPSPTTTRPPAWPSTPATSPAARPTRCWPKPNAPPLCTTRARRRRSDTCASSSAASPRPLSYAV